uniref:Methyltransferase type 11 domain-containing protein n=1 Tax=Haptolina ericina TaxID=156174 RepID=A0A7S3EXC4_9EUKA
MNDDVLSRIGMDLFFDEFAPLAPAGSACLEWGKPQYTTRVAACNASTTWNFRFARSGKAAINHKKRTLNADLNRLSASDMAGWPRFGTIICNQVFEHISSPFQAAVAIAEMLAPGGVLLFTAPFMEPFHRMPGDFFRYTFDGARTLFETAGLQVVAQRKIGNTMLASAHLLGFGSGDFEAGLLRRELVRKVDNPLKPMNRVDEWAFIETALVAHKTK